MSTGARNNQKSWFAWLRKGDFVIAGAIALAALALLILPNLSAHPATSALLKEDGVVIREWTSTMLTAGGQETLTAAGYSYTIAWENGRIRFLTANCPDQVCVQTGWISRDGAIAACVPGHLILKASGNGSQTTETSQVDVIVK